MKTIQRIVSNIIIIFTLSQTVVGCSAKTPSTNLSEIKASQIIAQLNKGKHICFNNCIIWGELDFTKLNNRNRITDKQTQVFVNSSVTFNNCVFVNKVKSYDATAGVYTEFAYNVSFTRCDFRDEIDLTGCVIHGQAFFTGSTFRSAVRLQGVHFRHMKTYFNETQFEGEALFQNTVFAGDVSFVDAVFSERAMFQKTVAWGLMFFGNVQFNDYADFTYSRAVTSIFRYAQFKGRYDFGDSQLNGDHPK